MENKSDLIEYFETMLEKESVKKSSALYKGVKKEVNLTKRTRDVIDTVNVQIKAIRVADCVKRGRLSSFHYNLSDFLTVDNLSKCIEECNQDTKTKFETQFVSDTQLIEVVKNAEVLCSNKVTTQDFDNTFDYKTFNKDRYNDKNESDVCNINSHKEADNVDIVKRLSCEGKTNYNCRFENLEAQNFSPDVFVDNNEKYMTLQYEGNNPKDECFTINTNLSNKHNSVLIDSNREINQLSMDFNTVDSFVENKEMNAEENQPLSPVLNIRLLKQPKSQSPLVVDLEAFEMFETITFPKIMNSTDFNTYVVNSQLVCDEIQITCKTVKESDLYNVNLNTENEQHSATDQTLPFNIPLDIKPNNSLQDEVLFSSDEEDNCVHKQQQDIPFTCVLQTPFYEECDIFDKTMYVGFQTASNKSIQVCSESFNKAKSVFTEIDNNCNKKEFTMTELVDKCDDISKYDNRHNILNCNEVNPTRDRNEKSEATVNNNYVTEINKISDRAQKYEQFNTVEDDNYCTPCDDNTNPITHKMSGFVTASNKNIKLSDMALSRCKKVFQGIDIDGPPDNNVEEKFDNDNEINKIEILPDIEDEHILQEFQYSEMIRDNILNEADTSDKKNNNKHIQKNKEELNGLHYRMTCGTLTDIHDSKAVSNKPVVESSIENTSKTKSIINNYLQFTHSAQLKSSDEKGINKESAIVYNASTDNGTLNCYENANNKQILVTNDTFIKTKHLNQDIDKPNKMCMDGIIRENFKFQGFKTANNKEINMSYEALDKSKKLFEYMTLEVTNYNSMNLKNKKNEKVSSIKEDKISEINLISEDITSVVAFKTANNKPVTISKETLVKSVKLFQDLDQNEVHISKKDHNNCVNTKSPSFVGFQTASNKTVNISAQALAKSKKIFQDIDIKTSGEYEEDILPIIEKAPALINFQYNNKNEMLSESFRKSKTKCEDSPTLNDINEDTSKIDQYKSNFENLTKFNRIDNHKHLNSQHNFASSFKEFQTTSNKEVKISEEALAKCKQIFRDEDLASQVEKDIQALDKNRISTFKGFQTASNKEVKISKEALDKCKQIFKDEDLASQVEKDIQALDKNRISTFKGFQTASNKEVTISKEALDKCKQIFQDEDLASQVEKDIQALNKNRISTFKGFQTASNKEVKISKEALDKCKQIFRDEDLASQVEKDIQALDKNRICTFKGFQTASNKEVKISEEALAKCKQIFQDEDLASQVGKDIQALDKNRISTIYNDTKNCLYENENFKIETGTLNNPLFKTASNRSSLISNDALIKSKVVLNELDNKSVKKNPKVEDKFENKEVLQNIINTQVLNNFDETLYTEDFHKDVTIYKRSTSPILLCPKAKKIKFETPYKSYQTPIEICKVVDNEVKNEHIFKKDYKKNKLYKLKDIHCLETKHRIINNDSTTNITFENLLNFVFSGKRNELTNTELKIEDLREIFMNAINQKLVPDGWLDNHLKLILWKLLSYEIVYPNTLGTVCTVENVLNQLKYRYDKELYNAERPALRKILEKDDVPSKTLILCIVDIKKQVEEKSVTSLEEKVEVLVTDGWYCIKACLDKMLTELVYKNKIIVGTKVVTHGAELLNCEQGVSPWEDTSSVRLKLFGNSTRRARWDARLGYYINVPIVSHLSLVRADGGKVSKIRVLVTRVYPALYIEKFEDGSTVTRSERLEHIHETKYESERQALLERLYEEVEKEFSDVESQDSEDMLNSSNKRKSLDSGSQISKMMKRSGDPLEFENQLTESQTKLLQDHASRRRERLIRDVQARLLEKMEKHGLCQKRNVVTLLKVRIAEVEEKGDGVLVTKGMLSVWKPNESVMELIKEGAWINVMNVVPTSVRCSELQISAGRQSVFNKSKYKENNEIKPHIQPFVRKCYHIKELIQRSSRTNGYNEIDTVGIIVSIEPSIQSFESNKNQFQNVFLADENKNIVCINFWGGLKKFGYERVLDTGQVFACVNLQERVGNTRKNIPQYRVTEFTYFTKTPKNVKTREIIEDLDKKLPLNRQTFCEECVKLKNNVTRLQNNENITPYRINNVNLVKNRMFIDTPTGVKANIIDDYDLSGLDFESTFKQKDTQELSPKLLLRRKQVNEKINRLKMYGEPPPLSTIHMINKSEIKSYKSPLRNVENSVAISKNIPENCPATISPVTSINRTYVKSVFNPVKINFDNVDNDRSGVDHFAEEFNGSPPLSLE